MEILKNAAVLIYNPHYFTVYMYIYVLLLFFFFITRRPAFYILYFRPFTDVFTGI